MPPIEANSNPEAPVSEGPYPVAKPVHPQPVPQPVRAEADEDFEYVERPRPRRNRRSPKLAKWVRALLVVMALGFVGVMAAAAYIHPYGTDEHGHEVAKTSATHTQLGMEPCNMVVLTGKPCPACGMTTSFSLLVHGDVPNSLRANWVGTLMAIWWFALIPWGFASAYRGRLLFIRNGEMWMTVALTIVLTLMVARWAVIFFG